LFVRKINLFFWGNPLKSLWYIFDFSVG